MLTPSGWTVLVLKKLRIRWCSSSKSPSFLLSDDVGETEEYHTRLLWTIPEEEEENISHQREHLIQLRRKKSSSFIKAYPRRRLVAGDCNCRLLMKCMELKSHLTASLKKMRKTANSKVSHSNNPKTEGIDNWSKPSSSAIAAAPHRSKADEEELRYQCQEIYELYRAITEGRLSLERILNLRL